MGGAPHPFFEGKALGTRLTTARFRKMVVCFNQVFFNGLIKPSDRHPYWFLSRGFILIVLGSSPSFSESPPILGDLGAVCAQYFSTCVDFPSPPLSSHYLPLGLWGWSPLGSKTVHIRQRAGKFFSKLMQTWRFASVSVRHISLAKILLNKKSLCTSRKASWLKGTKRCRKVISRAKYLSFSLSRNKKINWKPSSGRSQENEML